MTFAEEWDSLVLNKTLRKFVKVEKVGKQFIKQDGTGYENKATFYVGWAWGANQFSKDCFVTVQNPEQRYRN